MSKDLTFVTAISAHTTQGLVIRGKKLTSLVSEADFVATLFLSLTGRKAKKSEKKILNALLVAAMDHGINPASGFVPRAVASSGGDVLSAMASALLALGPHHGGAVTNAMRILLEVSEDGEDKEAACERLIDTYRLAKKRISGFGHPTYTKSDPRSVQLFKLGREEGLDILYMNLAKQMEHSLEQKLNKPLVLNIDGAMAALLLTIGIDPIAGNAIFGVARVAGSIAHITEEQNSKAGVRRIKPEDIEYAPE
jgi:citrate synthase